MFQVWVIYDVITGTYRSEVFSTRAAARKFVRETLHATYDVEIRKVTCGTQGNTRLSESASFPTISFVFYPGDEYLDSKNTFALNERGMTTGAFIPSKASINDTW